MSFTQCDGIFGSLVTAAPLLRGGFGMTVKFKVECAFRFETEERLSFTWPHKPCTVVVVPVAAEILATSLTKITRLKPTLTHLSLLGMNRKYLCVVIYP